MSTITLPNIRVSSDLTVKVRLKDSGVAIDWSTLNNVKASIYSDAQRALAGRCDVSIDAEDPTLLVCQYAANKPQYVGVNRIVVSAKYHGETKTYDKPAFSFVRWTGDQAGEQITIDDPDVDVEIDVEDVSSSILQEAVDAAFEAADRANDAAAAAEHMVDIHTGPEGKSAYEVAVEEGYVGTEEEWLASLVGPQGAQGIQGETGEAAGFGTVSVSLQEDGGQPSAAVAASGTDTAKNFAFTFNNLKGEKGDKGDQGNSGSSVDYPYELVNNCTTNDATKGLAASQGVALQSEVSQLEAEVNEKADQADLSQLQQEIDGNDNSATLTKSVTSGSSPNGVVSFLLKAGTYVVTSPNFSTLLPSLTLYFRKEDNTNITNKTASALISGSDFVLSEDCYSVYFYGGNALASGDLQFVFTDKNKTSGLRGDIAQVRTDLEADIAELDNKIFDGIVNASFAQGSYYQGSPSTDTKKVRYNRLFSKTELPVIISIPSTCKAKLANIYYYSDPSDYTSFLSSAALGSQYAKGITLDSAMLPTGANGVTVVFENEDNGGGTLYDITPAMMVGTSTKYRTIQDQVNELMPEGGISYYGKRIDVNITDRENKMQTETIVQHTPSSYVYTRYNQSMAIYNGLAFCFNDTQGADNCFCVVIDLSDGSVVTKIDTIPSVITAQRESHLNNANFTDVFFDPFDELPLLLLSRGDYADGSLKDQEMYIFRITPSGGSYVFTHIKTIKHRGTYYFNPSWEYDSQRKMIWGHNLIHGDWRFGNANYRKFNNFGLYFSAFPDTQYITIVSDEQAAENADITITVGTSLDTQTKTVSVQSGETIDPADFVMPYVLNVGGYSYIKLNQSADAFEGQYIVCACDANGDNRIPINFGSVLVGFPAPDLRDSTEVTINASDMTPEVEIDPGIFQGGCCFAGKLILPFSAFKTINGQAVTMGAQNCIVVDPTTGEIESVFPTGTLENQGCAVYDGKVYISSHNVNASSGNPSFDIVAYSF